MFAISEWCFGFTAHLNPLSVDHIVHTIMPMEIEFDPAKNERDICERGLSFERVVDFEFETALYAVDDRHNYGETRWRALGLLDNRLHSVVFVETANGIRVISFRKANQREVRRYESQTQS